MINSLKENLCSSKVIREFIRFSLVGLLNTVVSYLSYVLLIELSVNYQASNVISYIIGMITSYLLNKSWTFKVKERSKIRIIIKFMIVNLLALLVSLSIVILMVEKFDINIYIGQLFAITGSLAINFSGQKFWVFK